MFNQEALEQSTMGDIIHLHFFIMINVTDQNYNNWIQVNSKCPSTADNKLCIRMNTTSWAPLPPVHWIITMLTRSLIIDKNPNLEYEWLYLISFVKCKRTRISINSCVIGKVNLCNCACSVYLMIAWRRNGWRTAIPTYSRL